MSTPAHNTMEVNTSASIAAFQAKSAAEKVLSYMWYIHVLVSVNTEARLRAKIALVLDEHSVSPAAAASPEATFVNQHSEPDRQNQQQQQSSHDLTDHLILGLFSRNILSRLVDTAPVFAQADGYACILADVPVVFREEFCRRLYMLLFRRRIVEWPHGIDVPEPAIAATEPVVDVVAPVKVEDTCPSSETEQEDDVGGAALDGSTETMDEGLDSPAASHRPGASVWHQTPSLSSWDGDDIAYMERAAYFGTAANPVPMNYFADWEWSRDGCGPQGGFDEYNVLGERLSAPLPSPQDQGRKLGEDFRVSLHRHKVVSLRWKTGRKKKRKKKDVTGDRRVPYPQTRPSGTWVQSPRLVILQLT